MSAPRPPSSQSKQSGAAHAKGKGARRSARPAHLTRNPDVHGLAAGVTMAGVVMSLGFFYAKNPVLDVLLWASLLMAVTYTIVFLLSRYIFTTVDTELAPVPHPEPEVPEPQENLEEQ